MGAMTVEIEQILPARIAVADVGYSLDITATKEERPEQDAGQRKAAQPGGHPSVEGGAPSGAQAFAQGAVDRRARPQSPPCDDDEPGCRQDSQAGRRPVTGRVETALADGQPRRDEKIVEGHERQLVEHEAEKKADDAKRQRPAQRRQGQQGAARNDRRSHHGISAPGHSSSASQFLCMSLLHEGGGAVQ